MPQYREVLPAPHLRARVECFWLSTFPSGKANHRVVPDGCADIIYTRASSSSTLRFIGPMTRFRDFTQAPGSISLGIRFRPGMWSDVLKFGGAEAANQVLPLDALKPSHAADLKQRLDNCNQLGNQLRLLAIHVPPAPPLSPFHQAIGELEASRGTVALDSLAEISGFSTRQFRRKCLEQTALSPKLLARILRFRHAHARARNATTHADLALECGYFDQSHLIADFREFAGRTPNPALMLRLPFKVLGFDAPQN